MQIQVRDPLTAGLPDQPGRAPHCAGTFLSGSLGGTEATLQLETSQQNKSLSRKDPKFARNTKTFQQPTRKPPNSRHLTLQSELGLNLAQQ